MPDREVVVVADSEEGGEGGVWEELEESAVEGYFELSALFELVQHN